jgi:hypothetical protein
LREPQETLHFALQEFGNETRTLRHRYLLQLPKQFTVAGCLPDRARQHEVQNRWTRTAQHLRGTLPVGLDDGCLRSSVGDSLGERAEGGRGFQRNQALRTF